MLLPPSRLVSLLRVAPSKLLLSLFQWLAIVVVAHSEGLHLSLGELHGSGEIYFYVANLPHHLSVLQEEQSLR